jgi:hypothetical protein
MAEPISIFCTAMACYTAAKPIIEKASDLLTTYGPAAYEAYQKKQEYADLVQDTVAARAVFTMTATYLGGVMAYLKSINVPLCSSKNLASFLCELNETIATCEAVIGGTTIAKLYKGYSSDTYRHDLAAKLAYLTFFVTRLQSDMTVLHDLEQRGALTDARREAYASTVATDCPLDMGPTCPAVDAAVTRAEHVAQTYVDDEFHDVQIH